ncbi:mitochondrial FAD carrier protein [Lactarius tabidus]
MSTPNPFSQPSFFPTHAIDHAFAGIGAGTVAVLCMDPLDLVKLQVSTRGPERGIERGIWRAFSRGARLTTRQIGHYRLLNACSFLPKCRDCHSDNPIWVVKVPTFTTPPNSPAAHRRLWMGASGFRAIFHDEGLRGLYRGTSLALFGVSNGALQFMGYGKMKGWAYERKRRRLAKLGRAWTTDDEKLSNTAYMVMSGASKLGVLCAMYPCQVLCSRIQTVLMCGMLARSHHYRTITSTMTHTCAHEDIAGLCRGVATNLVRELLGTCVTHQTKRCQRKLRQADI